MRRIAIVAFLILSLMTGAFGIAQAQTPVTQGEAVAPITTETAPASDEKIPGASVEIFADVESDNGTAGMTLYEITLEPEVMVPAHEHFGSVTWYVDSGTLGFMVISGEVWVRCADDCVPGATPDASGFVIVPEGTEVVLQAGDWIIQHDTTEHAYRNAGDDTVVIDASTTYSLEETVPPTEVETPTAANDGVPAASPVAGPPITIKGCRGGCY